MERKKGDSIRIRLSVFALSVILVTLFGCSDDVPEIQRVDQRFMVTDSQTIERMEERVEDDVFSVQHEEYTITADKKEPFVFAIRNEENRSRCFYIQPKCKTALQSSDCDSASLSFNSNYYWEWFETPQLIPLEPLAVGIFKGYITGKGAHDTYLSQIDVYAQERYEGSCPKADIYGDRKNFERIGRVELRINLG